MRTRKGHGKRGVRTATLLPVPRSPMMRTPPMRESTTLSMSASFMSSWPTILTNGKPSICATGGAADA